MPLEVDLLDLRPAEVEEQPEHAQHLLGRADIGGRIGREDLDQLLAVLDQALGWDLGAGLAQEGLLPRRAHDVVVGVPVAREGERVEPAERLVARLQEELA